MKKLTLPFAAALMALAPLGASARVRARVFIGPPVVNYGYGYGYGWNPYYGPRYYAPYKNTGEVKIDNNKHISEAAVYVGWRVCRSCERQQDHALPAGQLQNRGS